MRRRRHRDLDHTKNHAFRLRQDGRWELAPAYDAARWHIPTLCGRYLASSRKYFQCKWGPNSPRKLRSSGALSLISPRRMQCSWDPVIEPLQRSVVIRRHIRCLVRSRGGLVARKFPTTPWKCNLFLRRQFRYRLCTKQHRYEKHSFW